MTSIVVFSENIYIACGLTELVKEEFCSNNERNELDIFIERDSDSLFSCINKVKPSMLIIDIDIVRYDIIHSISLIKNFFSDIVILAISDFSDEYLIHSLMQCRIDGVISKDSSNELIRNSIQTIYSGGLFFPKKYMNTFNNKNNVINLTRREEMILNLIKKGMNNNEICNILDISSKTVSGYRRSLFRKIGVKTIGQLLLKLNKIDISGIETPISSASLSKSIEVLTH